MVRKSAWPSAGAGMFVSSNQKFSSFGSPAGRAARTIRRFFVAGISYSLRAPCLLPVGASSLTLKLNCTPGSPICGWWPIKMSSRRSAGGRDKAASVFVQIAYHTTARLKLGTREHPRPALHSNCVLVSWQSPGKHLGGLGMISGRGVGANLRK